MDRMDIEKSLFNRLHHVGVVVRDMEKAIAHYQFLGIGPFETPKNLAPVPDWPPDNFKLRGKMAKMGQIYLELHQPVAGESLWKKFLDTRGEGISHLCVAVDDIDLETSKLKDKGFKVIYNTRFQKGGGACYFDIDRVGGIMLEVVQWPPE